MHVTLRCGILFLSFTKSQSWFDLEICKLIVSDIALQLCLISAGMNM